MDERILNEPIEEFVKDDELLNETIGEMIKKKEKHLKSEDRKATFKKIGKALYSGSAFGYVDIGLVALTGVLLATGTVKVNFS